MARTKNSNNDQKKPKGLIIAIVILSILVIGLGAFVIYNTISADKSKEEPPTTTEEPAEPKEDVVPDKPAEDNVSNGNDVGDKNENGGTDSGPGTVEDVTNE